MFLSTNCQKKCDAQARAVTRRTRILRYHEAMNLLERITVNPEQCRGRPCIRGMRIRVIDVLGLLAAGLSFEEILSEMPDLEREDIQAALQHAVSRLDHPRFAA
jgi:uncharacterized protein (DUF433 family)